jgi:hypothetical protein
MPNLNRRGLLALALAAAAVPAAHAQGLATRDQLLEPHQLMQRRYDNWLEGQRLAVGYYRSPVAEGRYPGSIFYRNPAAPAVRVYDYLHRYIPPVADLRSGRLGTPYELRVVRPPAGRGPQSPRASDTAPSGAGYGLYTGGR